MAELGQTYTGDAGALAKRIQTLTGQITSDIQNAPAVRQNIGGQAVGGEELLAPLAEQKGELINKILAADQQFAQEYGTPGTPTYIENPVARQTAIQQNKEPYWGALASVNTLIGARTNVLQDAMERGMAIYQAGLQAKQFELDSLYKQMQLMSQMEKATPTRDAVQQKALLEGIYNDVMQLDDAMRGNARGRIQGAIASMINEKLGTDSSISRLNAIRTRLALPLQQLYGRGTGAGVGGVKLLSEMRDVLPDVTDSPDEAAMKMNDIKAKLLSKALDNATVYGDASTPSYVADLSNQMSAMANVRPKQETGYKAYTGR